MVFTKRHRIGLAFFLHYASVDNILAFRVKVLKKVCKIRKKN